MKDNKSQTFTIGQTNEQYGKLHPQAIDVEEAVLGALIIESTAYSEISTIVSSSTFYREEHQKIFLVIKDISDSGNPISLLTVVRKLKDTDQLDEIGGPSYITELTGRVSSAVDIEHWAKILQQKFIQRELIRVSSEIQDKAYDDTLDIDELLQFSGDSVNNLFSRPGTNIKTPKQLMDELYIRIKRNLELSGISGFPSGLPKMDNHTGGFQKSDLTIIAAEPGQGKTSLLVTIMNNTTEVGNSAAILSLEMAELQLFSKSVSIESHLPVKKILNEKLSSLDIAAIDKTRESIEKRKLYIDDKISTLDSVISSIRFLHQKHGVEFFGIDFIQLVNVPKVSQEERLGKVSRALKNIAKELDISILALSQFNRSSDSKSDHRPSKDRLRGSGQIEEAADNIILIYRPEEYDIETFDEEQYIPTEGKALIIFAKGRLIGTTSFIINFKKDAGLFYEGTIHYIEPGNPNAFIEPNTNFEDENNAIA